MVDRRSRILQWVHILAVAALIEEDVVHNRPLRQRRYSALELIRSHTRQIIEAHVWLERSELLSRDSLVLLVPDGTAADDEYARGLGLQLQRHRERSAEFELRDDAGGVRDMADWTTQRLEHPWRIVEQFVSIAGDEFDRDFLHRDHEIEGERRRTSARDTGGRLCGTARLKIVRHRCIRNSSQSFSTARARGGAASRDRRRWRSAYRASSRTRRGPACARSQLGRALEPPPPRQPGSGSATSARGVVARSSGSTILRPWTERWGSGWQCEVPRAARAPEGARRERHFGAKRANWAIVNAALSLRTSH